MNHKILLPQLSILHNDNYICGSSLICASCLQVHFACCTSTHLWILENPGQRGTSLHMPLYDAKSSHDNLTCVRNVSCNLWVMSPQGTEVGARWTVYGTQQLSLLNCWCWVLQCKTDLNQMQSILPWGQQTLCSPERSQVLRSHWMSGTPRSLLISTVTYVHSSWSMQLPTLFVPEHKSSNTGFWHTTLPVTNSCLQKQGQSVDVYNNHVLNKANSHLNLLLTLLYLSCKGTSAAKSICCAAQLILRKQAFTAWTCCFQYSEWHFLKCVLQTALSVQNSSLSGHSFSSCCVGWKKKGCKGRPLSSKTGALLADVRARRRACGTVQPCSNGFWSLGRGMPESWLGTLSS